MAAAAASIASPLPGELAISGSISLDTVNSFDPVGGASQSGTLQSVIGGVTATSAFSAIPSSISPAALAGSLAATGDGFGALLAMSGTSTGGATQTDGLFVDYLLNLANNSATTTFTVVFRALLDNQVAASGADAFAFSQISVLDNALNEVLFSDHRVDTVNAGSNFSLDSANDTFSFVLAPGASLSFTALQSQRGGAFATQSAYSASLDAFLVLDSVVGSGGGNGGGTVPLPGSLPLLAIGLAALAIVGRGRVHTSSPRRT
jgi:hypothetical protein